MATTFTLIRPEAVERGLIADICKRFEKRGFTLVALKMLRPGPDLAHAHYKTSTSEPDKALLRAIADGPVVAAAWRGPNVVAAVQTMVGAAEPANALPGTIRGDLALSAEELLVECAADAAHAAALCALWFTAAELAAAPAGAAAPAAPPKPDAGVAAAAAAKPSKRAAPAAAGERFYVTTAINYANGAPHMGHAYEGITSDVVARYHKAYGREVFFLTGADEHGQKIADTAAAAGVEPIALVDKHVAQFQELNKKLAVENTRCVCPIRNFSGAILAGALRRNSR